MAEGMAGGGHGGGGHGGGGHGGGGFHGGGMHGGGMHAGGGGMCAPTHMGGAGRSMGGAGRSAGSMGRSMGGMARGGMPGRGAQGNFVNRNFGAGGARPGGNFGRAGGAGMAGRPGGNLAGRSGASMAGRTGFNGAAGHNNFVNRNFGLECARRASGLPQHVALRRQLRFAQFLRLACRWQLERAHVELQQQSGTQQ